MLTLPRSAKTHARLFKWPVKETPPITTNVVVKVQSFNNTVKASRHIQKNENLQI